jgi:ABC-type transport system involved in multi-copper enzyme maturation permease subunit
VGDGAGRRSRFGETFDDGSASLVLARPVGRATFALSRLAGVLAIAFATGAVLLGGTTALLYTRHDLAVASAVWGGLACALGAVVVASLAMAASLFLPRIAAWA